MADSIAVRLLIWAIPWMGAAILGRWKSKNPFWRSFWLMSGIWALVDALIALFGLLQTEPSTDNLGRILWINVGLDVLYVALGIYLSTRIGSTQKGFGLAIGVQGLFLLLFDLFHALQM